MAAPQSMTLQQRMNTINGDGIWDYSFQEACNRYVKANITGYSAIGVNDYTPEEAFAIIRDKSDRRSHTLEELINDMGSYGVHDYTSRESLNKQAAITEG
jgi:hypothetical protein